jgi:hypothetical protein
VPAPAKATPERDLFAASRLADSAKKRNQEPAQVRRLPSQEQGPEPAGMPTRPERRVRRPCSRDLGIMETRRDDPEQILAT